MKKLFKSHPKHDDKDRDRHAERAISPFTVVPDPPSPSPDHRQQHQQQQQQNQQQFQAQYARDISYRNSMAAYPSADDISSWELIQGHTAHTAHDHPYRQRATVGVNERERSASLASLSGSNTTLPNPHPYASQPQPQQPYAQQHSASRASSLNSLPPTPSPRTTTAALVTQSTAPASYHGHTLTLAHVPSPTSPGAVSPAASGPGPAPIGAPSGGVLRKKLPPQVQAHSQAPVPAPMHAAVPQHQPPPPPPPQASTAAILRALDPSMMPGMNMGAPPQQKTGLVSRSSIRSTHRDRDRDRDRERERERDAHARALPQTHTHPLPQPQYPQAQHTHLRVPALSSRKDKHRDVGQPTRHPSQNPNLPQAQPRTHHRSRSLSLSDIEFNASAGGASSGAEIDSSPSSSTEDLPSSRRRRSSSRGLDFELDIDQDADAVHERDSMEIERREREARWRERDLEIEGKLPRKGSAGKDREKDKDRDRDRDSRGFFDRLQFGDGDRDTRRDGSAPKEKEDKKEKKEKDDWKIQLTSIFTGKDKEKEKERTKKQKDIDSIDPLAPASSHGHQHTRLEISAPMPLTYTQLPHPPPPPPSQPYANAYGNMPPGAFTPADLAYHSTPAANAPLFTLTSAQAPSQTLAQPLQAGGDHLARMVGLFVSPSHDGIDWALALELCEQTKGREKDRRDGRDGRDGREGKEVRDVKEGEANAKSIAKALRKELKYARPSEQLGAVTLWAVMLQNASDFFITQTSSRKFLDVVEDVILHSRSTIIRDRLLEVLGAAAYLATQKGSKDSSKRENFKTVWRKVKPDILPDDGMPLSMDNPMFHAQPIAAHPDGDVDRLRPRPPMNERRSSRNGIIPIDEDIRRLFQECKIGRGNAQLLNEALAFATPEDLKEKDIIKEFYAKCRASQELIHAQIPWASAGAERSRMRQLETLAPDQNIDELPSTREEKLLAELLCANEELAEALRIYEEIERIGFETEAEKKARERSKVEIRASPMDYQLSGEASSFLAAPSIAPSSSRSQSPSSFLMNSQTSQTSIMPQSSDPSKYNTMDSVPASAAAFHHHLNQLQPAQFSGSDSSHSHTPSYTQNPSHLTPAPNRPLHGPRSPPPPGAISAVSVGGVGGLGGVHSRTSSPIHASRPNSVVHSRATSVDTNPDAVDVNARLDREASDQTAIRVTVQNDLASSETSDPVRLSEKAAGKRRMVDSSADLHDGFASTPNGDALHLDDAPFESLRSEFDTDEDNPNDTPCPDRWRPKIHYAYDAAAERTRERMRELAISGLG